MEQDDIADYILHYINNKTRERAGSPQLIGDKVRLCPLCASEMRLYYVTVNEKFIMCTNVLCDFPFGYEELQFVQIDNGEEVFPLSKRRKQRGSIKSRSTASTARSTASTGYGTTSTGHSTTSGLSDIDKICTVFELEEHAAGKTNSPDIEMSLKERMEKDEEDAAIKRSVEHIKQMNKQLFVDKRRKALISNKKWLTNLQKLQNKFGGKLVRKEELNYLKPELGKGELKIDIDENNSSTVKIQINCKDGPNEKPA